MIFRSNSAETERILLENYETYYRLAYSYTRNEEDALDIVQDSAYRAIRDCHSVRNKNFLSTWIYRIVINASLDLLRKRKREDPDAAVPEPVFEDRHTDFDLMEAVRSLDDKSRTIIYLRYFEDLKLDAIAQITEENLNTVKARLYRALKKLRLHLLEEPFDSGREHDDRQKHTGRENRYETGRT